jgi:RNA polymerase II subunit A small phosphatase-like protein
MDEELITYIIKTCKDLMLTEEMIALTLSETKDGLRKNLARKQYTGGKKNPESIALFDKVVDLETTYGNRLQEYIADRIYSEYKGAIENLCPKCGKLLRTRFARQCRHCLHTWHDVERILVVLDLDETLIHATATPPHENWDFEVFDYKVYKRPGLDVFLKKLSMHFDVAVWSSASDDYVQEIVAEIFPYDHTLKFIWGRSKCTRRIDYNSVEDFGYFDEDNHLNYTKPLKKVKQKLKRSLNRMLIVDDTPLKTQDNYGNAIYSSEFNGEPNDTELEQLWTYLYSLKNEPNVRTIEKRAWRTKV